MQSAYNGEFGNRRNSFVRFIVSSYPVVDDRIEHRSKVTRRLLGDKLPKTWMYSDPLRLTKCSCVSTVGALSALNAMNERTNEDRQREIFRIVSLRFYRSQKSWVASYYQPWAATTRRLEYPPPQLLFDMLLRCRNTRDMSDVMCLCEYYRPDSNIWESLARAPNDNFVNEKLHLQHSIQRAGILEDLGYRCESSYEHDGRSPLERLVAQIVRYYTSEIFGSSCELTATARVKRVIDETRDRFFTDECSVRREKPPPSTTFASEERGSTGRYYIRQYMRQYKLKRNGCAFDADELKECVRNSHFKNGQLASFEKLNNYFNDSGDDSTSSNDNDDDDDDEAAEAYHDQPLTLSFRGLPATPSYYGETHHIARFPDFIGETWRRYIWRELTPLGFARITKQIWHTLIPFDRRQFGAYDNFTLCRKVHCEQSRSRVGFYLRHYDREEREKREALYAAISRKRTRIGGSEESTLARSTDNFSASSEVGLTTGSERWLNLAIDPSKIVDSEATMRASVSICRATKNIIAGNRQHDDNEIMGNRADDDSIVTLVPGIRLLRDYGDWNSVWFVAILFDRVLNDLNEYSGEPGIIGNGVNDDDDDDDDDDVGEESSYLTPPSVMSATMTERWRVWRRMLNYALANDLRHALAPLNMFFRRDELRRKLESIANAEVSRTTVPELSTLTITATDLSDGTADKIREHTARCYFHENRSAGMEWTVVDAVRNGGIAPSHLHENNSANSRVREDVLEIMRSVCSKYHLRNQDHSDGESSVATDERNDSIVDSSSVLMLAANATVPSAVSAEASLSLTPPSSFTSIRAIARQEDRGTLLATALRKCFEIHGLTNREVLRIPVFRRFARDVIERFRDYYICEVLIRRGGGSTCRDISLDIARRISRNRTNVSDEDLIEADAIMREHNEERIEVADGCGDSCERISPRRNECWSSFLVDSV